MLKNIRGEVVTSFKLW